MQINNESVTNMFRMTYKQNGQIQEVQSANPKKLANILGHNEIKPEDIIKITGPRKSQNISHQTLLRIASGQQVLPGQTIKTPRFMRVIISHMFWSESEANAAGYVDNSGYESENISIFGKILPNGRPIFAAALK